MNNIKSNNIFERLEARQFNSNQIAVKLERHGYIKNLPFNYVSSAGITKDDMIEKLNKFLNCGSIAEVSEYADGKHIVKNANYCGSLGCWHCGSRAERKRYKRVKPKLDIAEKSFKYAYHVIFTIKDGQNVRERSLHLRESLKRFRKIRGGEYETKCKAALFSQEIVEGSGSKEYHTHCHSVFFTDEKLDFMVYDPIQKAELIKKYGYGNIPKLELDKIAIDKYIDIDGKEKAGSSLSTQWYKATKYEGCNIKAIPIESEKDYHKALKEVIKYATKVNENAPGRVAEIMAECHGMRFFSTAKGLRYKIKDGEKPPEFIRREDQPVKIINMLWNKKETRFNYFEPTAPQQQESRDKIKSIYQAETARELAEYRKRRSALLKNPLPDIPLFIQLDNVKKSMRIKVKSIWQRYERLFWKTYQEIKITADIQRTAEEFKNLLSLDWYSGIDTA